MKVLGASVVLKWFVEENDIRKARDIRSKYVLGELEIIIPDLLLYECTNALHYHPDFSQDDIHSAPVSIFDLGFEIITPTITLLKKAITMVSDYDITIYDATYLAPASELEDNLITADVKLYKRLSDTYKTSITLHASI